jgi:hypothetical protein
MELPVTSQTQAPERLPAAETYTPWFRTMTGYFIYLTLVPPSGTRLAHPLVGRTWTHTTITKWIVGAHAVEFSKTAKPHRKGFLLEETDPTHAQGRLRADRGV